MTNELIIGWRGRAALQEADLDALRRHAHLRGVDGELFVEWVEARTIDSALSWADLVATAHELIELMALGWDITNQLGKITDAFATFGLSGSDTAGSWLRLLVALTTAPPRPWKLSHARLAKARRRASR